MDTTMLRLYRESKATYENSLYNIISDLGKDTSTNLDWEGRKQFYTVLKEGFDILINDEDLFLNKYLDCCYRSGLALCIKTYNEGIAKIILPIQDISDCTKRAIAVEKVYKTVNQICEKLVKLIDTEYDFMKFEISEYLRSIDKTGASLTGMNLSSRNKNEKKDYNKFVSQFLEEIKKWKDDMKKSISKQAFDEYWDKHQSEKVELESEKQSLAEQLPALNQKISEIPEKTEGYSKMVELLNKVENLKAEKKSLGFFKFKDKKAVQVQIDAVENEIAPIQSRIDAAIEEVKKQIFSIESRIRDIDTELTKPRYTSEVLRGIMERL